jgi:hypothetical protein
LGEFSGAIGAASLWFHDSDQFSRRATCEL